MIALRRLHFGVRTSHADCCWWDSSAKGSVAATRPPAATHGLLMMGEEPSQVSIHDFTEDLKNRILLYK